jgi:hypothetical protein
MAIEVDESNRKAAGAALRYFACRTTEERRRDTLLISLGIFTGYALAYPNHQSADSYVYSFADTLCTVMELTTKADASTMHEDDAAYLLTATNTTTLFARPAFWEVLQGFCRNHEFHRDVAKGMFKIDKSRWKYDGAPLTLHQMQNVRSSCSGSGEELRARVYLVMEFLGIVMVGAGNDFCL